MEVLHMTSHMPTILCCVCGTEIQQNPCNMCVACVRNNVDITADIHKQLTLHSCRSCARFLGPPWQHLELESKELMALCLRKISGLSSVKLVDAVWIWTEPHSMRVQIKLTVQKEVMNGAILQQAAVVNFVIRNQQCRSCEQAYAQGAWHAIVQVRQRVSHKRTFFFLEQLLLKFNAHADCLKIVTFKDGMDFYFREKNLATRFIDFLNANVPIKQKYSRKLVSADHRSNVGEFKHNFIIEIAPVCKDDLVVLPFELARKESNMSRLVLVKRVAAGLHVVDPLSNERTEINAEKYWRDEFGSVMSSRQLTTYVVLSVEPILQSLRPSAKARGSGLNMNGSASSSRSKLAECVVARERDFGVNDQQFVCTTHLGSILKAGDSVLGYDLTSTNWNLDEDSTSTNVATTSKAGKKKAFDVEDTPDVVLVRKQFASKGDRKWRLKKLNAENANIDALAHATGNNHRKGVNSDGDGDDMDYELFLQELEADREMRTNVNLYKNSNGKNKAATSTNNDASDSMQVDAAAVVASTTNSSTFDTSTVPTKPILKSRIAKRMQRKQDKINSNNDGNVASQHIDDHSTVTDSVFEQPDDTAEPRFNRRKRKDFQQELLGTISFQNEAYHRQRDATGDDSEDDEGVRLDELLDDLELDFDEAPATDDAAMAESRILTVEEAQGQPTVQLQTSGFDAADYNPKNFKFV